MAKVLIVEDDQLLSKLMSDYLKKDSHQTEVIANGRDAIDYLDAHEYDVVVLDWELPGLSGIEILKRLRAEGKSTPVLMLTKKSSIEEKEIGFETGTDDFLPKPFDMRELSARVKALLRRPQQYTGQWLTAGSLRLDAASRVVARGEEDIRLLPKEFALLEFFMRHPKQVFSATALLNHVWSSDSEASEEAVSICIRRLRKKIDIQGQPSLIRTVHGEGYKLDC